MDQADIFVNRSLLLEIEARIRQAALVIVDLSDNRPSVLYECGFAHALLPEKKVIHITSDPYEKLPFDVKDWPTLSYTVGNVDDLRRQLTKRVGAAFATVTASKN